MWKRLVMVMAFGVALGALPTVAGAVPFTIDQQCPCQSASGSFLTFPKGNHFGQEFTPAQSSVEVVQLFLDLETSNPQSTLTVNIRNGTTGETLADILSRPILGMGSTIIPANSSPNFFEVDLASPVALNTGKHYVIDATESDNSSSLV